MSSNIKVLKICEYCKREFVARKTTSKTCSDDCAKRLYKLKRRNSKIDRVELETESKRRPSAFITEEEIKIIQAKKNLTLKEAAILLNISPLTLRRWTLAGKIQSEKIGKKHSFLRSDLMQAKN
jgi:excisionase family DNA binding protein